MAETRSDLVVEDLPEGGLLVMDPRRERSHTLNAAAAVVWKAWNDGIQDVDALASHLATATPLPADAGIVHAALAQLHDAGLVGDAIPQPRLEMVSRRRLLGLAAGVAFALPFIETIVTPSPAAAQSGAAPPPAPPPAAPPPAAPPSSSP